MQSYPKKVKVVDGVKSIFVSVEMDSKPVEYEWVIRALGLDESFVPESMETSDQGEEISSKRWQEVDGEKIVRRRVQYGSGQRKIVGDRLGWQTSHKEISFNRKGKVGGWMDKGKQVHVRSSKRRTSHPACLNSKLILDKQKVVSDSVESWTSTSDSNFEEGQLRNFGLVKGECSRSRPKVNGLIPDGLRQSNRQKVIGPLSSSDDGMSISFGMQEVRNQYSDGNGQLGSANRSPHHYPRRVRAASAENVPKQIMVKNSEQRIVSLSDSEGRLMSMPINNPVQLPLKDGKGCQIRGKDLREVPLAVEIEGLAISDPTGSENRGAARKAKSARCYWSLEEEITKVIEKGVALGHIITSKTKEKGQEQHNGDTSGFIYGFDLYFRFRNWCCFLVWVCGD
ncbi:hypothetical protein LWI29_032690 [Acer saccharum]|uniref:Uncharacterized protein n=1 Tax=Acer saccharum TaxID=4024 RepID=A0AA39RRW7_ACESA|nr:hypothetical protein LWI29_032690 [Acer saccharum]